MTAMRRILAIALMGITVHSASAEKTATDGLDKASDLPLLHAKRCEGKVTIDGNLQESDWKSSQWVGDFTPHKQGCPAGQMTRVAVLYDDTFLYVGFDCREENIDEVRSFITQRDGQVFRDNAVELFLAPKFGKSRYYHFVTNLLGTKFDQEKGGEGPLSVKWNGQWQSVAKKHEDRYVIEVAVPWTDLGVTPAEGNELGCFFARTDGSQGEIAGWFPGGFHANEKFARLILEDTAPLNSFSVDHRLLMQNPPLFKPAEGTVDQFETEIKFFKGESYVPGSTPVLEWVSVESDGESAKPLSEAPLAAGKYTVLLNWKDKGKILYGQQVGVTLVEVDQRVLVASLSQPFYSIEPSIIVEYTKRDPAKKKYSCTILSETGEKLAQSTVYMKGKEGEVSVSLSSIAENGNYVLTIEPTGKTGEETLIELPFEKGPALGVPTRYSVGKSGKWLKNGEEFLPVMMFLPVDYGALVKAGFNTVVMGNDQDAFDPEILKKNIKMLDDAAEHNLSVWFHACTLFRQKEDYAGLRNIVARLKTHPALGGWYTADEPSAYGTGPQTLKKAADIIHKLDPDHPVIGLSNNPPMFKAYAKAFNTFMCDPYPIPVGEPKLVSQWIELGHEAVGEGGSYIVCLQAFGKPYYKRGPTAQESWNMAYQGVAGGGNGISWWAHGPARGTWDLYEKLVPEVRKIMEITAFSKSSRKFKESGVYSTVFETTSGTVVVCVNTTKEARQVVVPVQTKGSVVKLDSGSSAELKQGAKELTMVLSEIGFGAWIIK